MKIKATAVPGCTTLNMSEHKSEHGNYYRTVQLIRNGKAGPGWISYFSTGAFYPNFSIPASDYRIFYFFVNLSLSFLLLIFLLLLLIGALHCCMTRTRPRGFAYTKATTNYERTRLSNLHRQQTGTDPLRVAEAGFYDRGSTTFRASLCSSPAAAGKTPSNVFIACGETCDGIQTPVPRQGAIHLRRTFRYAQHMLFVCIIPTMTVTCCRGLRTPPQALYHE